MAMEMRGSLNLSKSYKKPNQPKFYGKALIEGKEYAIKGWEKVRQDTGEVWISLLFEDPAEEGAREFEQMAKPKAAPGYVTREYPNREDDPDWRNDDEPF